MCATRRASTTPVTETVPTTRPIRSRQVNKTTGLTLNQQRRLNTRVRRGARLADIATPGWHKGVKDGMTIRDIEQVVLGGDSKYGRYHYSDFVTRVDVPKELIYPLDTHSNRPEVHGGKIGLYAYDIDGDRYVPHGFIESGLVAAWQREARARS